MDIISATASRWFVTYAPRIFTRWYWTDERLRNYVFVDFVSGRDPIEFWASNPQHIEVYLSIYNMLPFKLEIDRIEVGVECRSNFKVNIQHIKHITVDAISKQNVRISKDEMDFERAFATADQIPDVNVTIYVRFVLPVREFEHNTNQPYSIRPHLINGSKELREKVSR